MQAFLIHAAILLTCAPLSAQDYDSRGRVEKLILNGEAALRVPGGVTGNQLGWIEFYDGAEGGEPIWKSPAMNVAVVRGRARFKPTRSRLFFTAAATERRTVFVQFRVGRIALVPRYVATPQKVPFAWDVFHRPYYALRLDLSPVPGQGGAVDVSERWTGDGAFAVTEEFAVAKTMRPQDPAPRPKRSPVVPSVPVPERTQPSPAIKVPPAVLPSAPSPEPPKPETLDRRGLGPSLEDFRLANIFYFDALRAYREGDFILALYKLEKARSLNPDSKDIQAALGRVRGELNSSSALAKAARTPSPEVTAQPNDEYLKAAKMSYDLYFDALRNYGKGQFKDARKILVEASRYDPSNDGVANALDRLDREMSADADVH